MMRRNQVHHIHNGAPFRSGRVVVQAANGFFQRFRPTAGTQDFVADLGGGAGFTRSGA
jgi:hypothetical protein